MQSGFDPNQQTSNSFSSLNLSSIQKLDNPTIDAPLQAPRGSPLETPSTGMEERTDAIREENLSKTEGQPEPAPIKGSEGRKRALSYVRTPSKLLPKLNNINTKSPDKTDQTPQASVTFGEVIDKSNIVAQEKLPSTTTINGAAHESPKKSSSLVRSNSKAQLDQPRPANVARNLQAEHLQQKVEESIKNQKFVSMIENHANELVNEKGFSSGKYDKTAVIYSGVADGCRKAIGLIDSSESNQISKLQKQAKLLDAASEKIDKKANSINKDATSRLNKVGFADKHNEKIAEEKEIHQARQKFHLNEKYSEGKVETLKAKPLIDLSNECLEEAKNPLISREAKNELRSNAHLLSEKAARVLIGEGKAEEAFKLRSEFIQKLGSPPLVHDTQSRKILETKNASVSGAFLHDMSSKTVKGGNINVDHRTIQTNGVNREVTAINMTMNYHVRQNIDNSIETDPQLMISAMEKTFPELKGKISISRDDHYVFRKKIDSDAKIFDGDESSGTKLGKTWSLKIDGVGELSIPILPEIVFDKELKMDAFKEDYRVLNYNSSVAKGETQGYSPCNTTIMHDIRLEMNSNVKVEDQLKYAQLMLAMTGTGPVFERDISSDQEKSKLLESFQAFFPSQALEMKVSESTLSFSVDQLKIEIDKVITSVGGEIKSEINNTDNQDKKEYLQSKLTSHEFAVKGYQDTFKEGVVKEFTTIDGRKGYNISNRSQVVRERSEAAGKPIYGLFAGVGGSAFEAAKDANGNKIPVKLTEAHVRSALRVLGGMKSTLTLLNEGIPLSGNSSDVDLANGGGNNLFTRPAGQFSDGVDCNEATLAGAFKLLVGLEALDEHTDSFIHPHDAYAANDPTNITKCVRDRDGKMQNDVLKQQSITESFGSLDPSDFKTCEVGLSGRLDPKFYKGMVVSTEENRQFMRAGLLTAPGLFENEKFNGIHIDDFLTCQTRYKAELWKK